MRGAQLFGFKDMRWKPPVLRDEGDSLEVIQLVSGQAGVLPLVRLTSTPLRVMLTMPHRK